MPNPVDFSPSIPALPALENLSKIIGNKFCDIPTPVSDISIDTISPVASFVLILISPPAGVNFIALFIRL